VVEIIELQKNVFREFVRLSDEVGKPLAIHCWNADKKDKDLVGGAVAYEDILEIISSYQLGWGTDFQSGDKKQDTKNKIQTNSRFQIPNYEEQILEGRESVISDGVRNNDSGSSNWKQINKNSKLSFDNQVLKGVIHSFIGNYKTAQRFIDQGFLIGLNGIITYSESYDRLIKEIGLENIILETDAPYLTPNPLERYSRNEPLNVKFVAQKIADVLKVNIEEVTKQTTTNAKNLFKV